METHTGDLPLNARVKVTYGDKNKVDFSYPSGGAMTFWGKFRKKAPFVFVSYYGILIIAVGIYFSVVVAFNFELFLTILAESSALDRSEIPQRIPELIDYFYLFVIGVAIPFLLSIKVTLNGKWFDKTFPKTMAAMVSKGYLKIDKLDTTIYELPLFKNVILDYKATEEFGKELVDVEIIEHDYKRYRKFKSGRINDRGPQSTWWKAIFTFNNIPKKGYLEIYYC